MSENSKIEWTDATWNPVRGCTKISPGCANCYAETFAERFRGVRGHPFEFGFDLRLVPEKLAEPTYWPMVLSVGITVLAWGAVTSYLLSLLGLGMSIVAIINWIGDIRREQRPEAEE